MQVYFYKTKGGVDGASQIRAAMNHPGGCSKWEEKLVTQIVKNGHDKCLRGQEVYGMRELLPQSGVFRIVVIIQEQHVKVIVTASFHRGSCEAATGLCESI